MKSLFMFVALFLAMALIAPIASAQQEQTMSKRELKGLLASATTSEDHQNLAVYFTQEADRLNAKAAKHEQEAIAKKKNPDYFAVKNPAAFGAQHCSNTAGKLRRDAAKAQTFAAQHSEMTQQSNK